MNPIEFQEQLDSHQEHLRSHGARGQDLSLHREDLTGVDFSGMNLTEAYFIDGDLTGADFRNARLIDATFERCTMRDARFGGACLLAASFYNTDMSRTRGLPRIHHPKATLVNAARAALEHPVSLYQDQWHVCESTHCIAGWAEYLAKDMREEFSGYGTEMIGLMLLGPEAHAHFWDSTKDAMVFLQSVLDREVVS